MTIKGKSNLYFDIRNEKSTLEGIINTQNTNNETVKRTNSMKDKIDTVEKGNRRISYEELKLCIFTRDFIAKNVYKPFFSCFKGHYVRVSFKNGYAVCKILDVEYGKEYTYPLGNYTFRTDKYLRVQHGNDSLKISITYISNRIITNNEYAAQKESELEVNILSDYTRTKNLMERKMTKAEQIKYDDEKRNFMLSFVIRKSHYKTDLARKRKEALNEKKLDLAKDLADVYEKFYDNEFLTSLQLNQIARKYNLKVPGGEVEHDAVQIKRER